MRKESAFFLSILLITLTANQPAGAIRYTVTDLGTLEGYDIAHAYSINNKGQIVGYVLDLNFDGSVYQRAVLFDSTGAGNNIDLGTLGGENSSALSINNNGQTVGGADSNETWHATIFDPNGSANNTGIAGESMAFSNNDNGQIVGCTVVDPSCGYTPRAALFEPDSEPNIINLGTLPAYSKSEALSINNNSVIVGLAYNASFEYPYADARAVLFDPTGHADNIDLGTLSGYESAIAFSVNNSGQIVGRANNHDMSVYNWNPRAVILDPTDEGNNIDLGALPGYDSAEAFSINNKGQIVGRAIINNYPSGGWDDDAVLFDATGRGNNVNLNELIDPALGYGLSAAIAINDKGCIVCWGSNPNGDSTSFLLTPIPAGPSDFELDGDVDLGDFAVLAGAWRTSPGDENWNPNCDISEPPDGLINERDLLIFAANYLADAP